MSNDIERRYRALDSLRGIAATLVIFFHVNWNNHITGGHFIRHTFLCVDLFFILSGFIISIVYFDRIQTAGGAARFMTLRFFRIYPLHFATLLFLVAIESSKYIATRYVLTTDHSLFAYERTVEAIVANLLLLQGSGILSTLSWNTPSWSISCEMFAYLMFACMGVLGWLKRALIPWLIFPVLAGYAYLAFTSGTLNLTYNLGLVRCFCGFSLGMIIASTPMIRIPWIFALIAGLSAVLSIANLDGISESLVIPAFAVLIYALRDDDSQVTRCLHAAPLAFLGKVSFSIYMVHYIVISLIGTLLKVVSHAKTIQTGWQTPVFDISPSLGDSLVCLTVAISILAAYFSYRFIEVPGRQTGYRLVSLHETN